MTIFLAIITAISFIGVVTEENEKLSSKLVAICCSSILAIAALSIFS